MQRARRFGGLLVAVALVAATLGAGGGSGGIEVVGGTPQQQEMARWATQRFWTNGLTIPTLEIRFHEDREVCRGRTGYYAVGVVDVCRVNARTDDWAARELLHEMAHGWLEVNVAGAARDRFLRLRGLSTWNDPEAGWEERGFEHGAEIVAWAIGGQAVGTRLPSVPGNSVGELTRAYEALTGRPLPVVDPADRWSDPTASR
jgi:hypothetical protein